MKTFFPTMFLSVILVAPVMAADAEKKIQMQDLPPAVQQAVQEQSKGATVRGLAREVENGKTLYEAELSVDGRTKDITLDADGKVLIVEDEVAIESIPAPARDAIQKAVGRGKLEKVESVAEKGTTFYEGHFRNGRKTSELKVDAEGHPAK